MKDKKQAKKTTIGGQAVIEGVMMRGKTCMSTAVRDSDGIIRLESKRLKTIPKRSVLRLPIIRGVFSFISSLVFGTKVLMRSAEVFGESEPSKFEKWCSEKLKIDILNVVIFFSLLVGLGLSVALFMILPQVFRRFIVGNECSIWAKNFIEGGFKLVIFVFYILLCSLIPDVKRTFMYHGAEHKTISCFEKGLDLTVDNAKKCTRVHDRCGTTFIFIVLMISILAFALFESLIQTSVNGILRVACKILLLPVVAGISYEILKFLSKTDFFLFYPFKIPGLLLQRITTKEPTNDMLEVAITAFNEVLKMDEDLSIKEKEFVCSKKLSELVNEVKNKLLENGIEESAEAEWIVSITLKIKRDDLSSDKLISPKNIDKIYKLVEERITGKPLWYCIGNTDFMGYEIKVNENVLIPRPETELLCEKAIKICENKDVLDLCTGSGAIAIAISKGTNARVCASDISEKAIEVAKDNAKINGAEIEFFVSDMFSEMHNKMFDVIVSNPPYIKSKDIDCLQKEVRDFEPKIALDGGEDGLKFYKIIADNCKTYLNKNGVILLECGFDQANDVKKLFESFCKVEIIKDYENIDRIVKAEINV